MSLNFYIDDENKREESLNNYKDLFSNFCKKSPTLNESLNQMFKSVGFDDFKVNSLTRDIINKSKKTIVLNLILFNKNIKIYQFLMLI